MTRTEKFVTEGDQELVLASLTMDQVEEFWDNKSTDIKTMRHSIWAIILHSIHNAGSDITLEQLKKKTTITDFNNLRDMVLEVSGLAPKPGENLATPTPTSASSGVALPQP